MQRALDRLLSLQVGDQGVLDVVAVGSGAIPALRRLLFARDPSGLFQARCRVVAALAALEARDVLLAFLQAPHACADAVEAAGEDAVINAAARALGDVRDESVFQVLLSLADRHSLPGPVEVLGGWRRPEALPCLVWALADDLARPAAEAALRQYGDQAFSTLTRAIDDPVCVAGDETESSRRRRRAAITLLLDQDAAGRVPDVLRVDLMQDEDAALSVLGCRLALAAGSPREDEAAARRLVDWLGQANWFLRAEIEDILVAHADRCKAVIAEHADGPPPRDDDQSRDAVALRALRRVAARFGP
ncbi:hypothetical protein [Rhodopila globiformis]|uniref:HEAT repeat domain-containing protein n=1 Tax=Rhodopila globiformis TaxID=1071 RepID=A0A2S6NG30_RHOGL|nr:hypothetical protein [Rhodopila globiformis]PPQ33605.1 hypothetical protein CCS01_14045 [Rhodopila globiformis]